MAAMAGMDIEEVFIFICASLAVIMILYRLEAGFYSWKYRKNPAFGYESGASKTIGDREIQEDAYGIMEAEGGILAVLADGAGKELGGKIAAGLAVDIFEYVFEGGNAFYNPQYYFRSAFQMANREILDKTINVQGRAAVSAVVVKKKKLYHAVAGNVKVAVYRNGELVPVSAGHTIDILAKQKYMEGKLSKEEAAALLDQHRLYNYVGQDGFKDVEFLDTPITLYGGEYVLLMSDGLYETAGWKEIEDCLGAKGSCQEKAYRIIDLVNNSKEQDKDNACVVVLKIK